jgi:predicted nucleic acid-binding protein
MTPVVIDASAGAEIVTDTRRGAALLRLLPQGADPWVPEHFFAEVLAVIRRKTIVTHVLDEAQGREAAERLGAWQIRRASVRPLLGAAWSLRHNMSAADALYVVLAEQLSARFLTDDHNLVEAPTFPRTIKVLQLPLRP